MGTGFVPDASPNQQLSTHGLALSPRSLAFSSEGAALVVQGQNAPLEIFPLTGTQQALPGTLDGIIPSAITFGADGDLYASVPEGDRHRLMRITADSSTSTGPTVEGFQPEHLDVHPDSRSVLVGGIETIEL